MIVNITLLDIVVKTASKTFLHSDTHPSFLCTSVSIDALIAMSI